ncbi:MAG: hypothetical protein RLZZ26_67 [Candidatus Parcubacteria bacterium]|jgi:prepilin-type N-terminal cleavage/methylation domain-containing protein
MRVNNNRGMRTARTRGFTLIELLVVIAIIGILSAVVLASLNTARTKGNDASVKANLDTVRTQSGLYFDAHSNSYNTTAGAISVDCGTVFTANTMLADSNISRALATARTANGGQALYCNIDASGQNYAIAAPLASGGWWCTDSTSSAQGTQGGGATPYTALSGSATAALTNATDYTCN